MKTRQLLALSLAGLMLAAGCERKASPEPEGYRVVSYDSVSGKWVIIRTGTFDGKFLRKRMTVVCDFYVWGHRESVKGPQACDLRVGRLMVPNPLPAQGKSSEFLDIWEMSPDRLSITEGEGDNQVNQQFIIMKNEIMPD